MLAAAVGVVYRRPIGAVVTVQRIRRRLNSTQLCSVGHASDLSPQHWTAAEPFPPTTEDVPFLRS